MTASTSIARPYARAAFEFAHDNGQTDEWALYLETCAIISEHADVLACISDPTIDKQHLLSLYRDVLKPFSSDERDNFLQMLFEKNRLRLVPQIRDMYAKYREKAQQKVTANVYSRYPLSDAQLETIKARLKQRFARDVELNIHFDEEMLGGFVVRAGDTVIDLSVRSMLHKLKARALA